MPRNGSGTHSFAAVTAVAGQVASAATVNTNMDDLSTEITNSINKDGTKAFAANQSMGNFKLTNMGSGTARTDSVALSQVQDGKLNWVDGGGTADAITATYSPAITALVDGQVCHVRATAANATTTPTFAPNGLTARTIVKQGGQALAAGDIRADGHELTLRYDLGNTRWELINPVPPVATVSLGANSFTAVQTITIDNAVTNAVTDILKLGHTTSGTAAASFGAGLLYQLEQATGTLEDAASIDVAWVDAADTTEDAKISFKTMVAGAAKAEAAYIGIGLVVGSPTGGDKGAGTVNATGLYINGTQLSVSQWSSVFKTANETVSASSAYQDDDALLFAVSANKKYVFRCEVFYETTAAADFKWQFTGPAAPTLVQINELNFRPDGLVNSGDTTDIVTSFSNSVSITAAAGTIGRLSLAGIVHNGANAGTVTLQWAQVSASGDTIVRAGSFLDYRQVD